MNWVLMLVLLVLVCCAIYGYTKGFLRIVFSLVAWVIVLVFVSWATPHVSHLCGVRRRERWKKAQWNSTEKPGNWGWIFRNL